jgi:ferredoxin
MDRREFLIGGFLKPLLKVVETQVRVPGDARPPVSARAARPERPVRRAPPPLRPPGAVAESEFLRDCTRCGDCIRACPHAAILTAGPRWGQAAGTPIVDPLVNPCLQCVDSPCITVCEPKVLVREPDAPMPIMGTARIDPFACLAHLGTTCSTCRERCPVPGAISVDRGRPTVVPDVCTGCGVCAHVCPAPHNAIAILPAQRSS